MLTAPPAKTPSLRSQWIACREAHGKVAAVVNNPSLFRRLPVEIVESDPDLFVPAPQSGDRGQHLAGDGHHQHDARPDWPRQVRACDGQGTTGVAEYVYRSGDTHIIYSDGAYEGPLSPGKLRGQCVLVIETGYIRQSNGRTYVTTRLDAFLRLDNIGTEWVARTLQPLVGRTADHNFDEASTFLATVAHTAETNPAGIARLSRKLARVDPTTREEFHRAGGPGCRACRIRR